MLSLSRKSTVFLIVVAVVLCVFITVVYYVYLSPSGPRAKSNSDLARVDEGEVVRYTDLDGNDVDLARFDEAVLIVNAWASWSPFTSADHDVLARIKSEFGDRIAVRAVNRMESKETALAYLATIGRRDGIEYVIDTTDHFYGSQGGYAMPETLVFDAVGNLLLHTRGTLSYESFHEEVTGILAEIE